DSKNHQIEQSLSARSHVFRKVLIDKDIDCGEKERVADTVQNIHTHNQPFEFWISAEGKNRKPSSMTQNSKDHRHTPSQPFQEQSQYGHRQNLGDLPD